MRPVIRILFVDDNELDVEITRSALVGAGIAVESQLVNEESDLRLALKDWHPDIILSDFAIPGFAGMRAFEISQQLAPGIPFVFLSGGVRGRLANEAIARGAADYVEKGDPRALRNAIMRALHLTHA